MDSSSDSEEEILFNETHNSLRTPPREPSPETLAEISTLNATIGEAESFELTFEIVNDDGEAEQDANTSDFIKVLKDEDCATKPKNNSLNGNIEDDSAISSPAAPIDVYDFDENEKDTRNKENFSLKRKSIAMEKSFKESSPERFSQKRLKSDDHQEVKRKSSRIQGKN